MRRDYRPHGVAAIMRRARYAAEDLLACVLGMAGMIGAVILAAALA